MKKLILSAVVVVAVAGGVAGFAISKDDPKPANAKTESSQTQKTTAKTEVTYKGVENQNALETLKQSHKVETKNYEGIGEMVTSIDGTAADSKHFWSFYVNGQQAQVGAGAYTAANGDTITWKLEEIK